MKEEEGKKFGIWAIVVGHGRATTGTGRAKLLALLALGVVKSSTTVPRFWRFGSIFFFRFLESVFANYLQNNLKQRKTNKIKAIKCVGCLPRSARLESLA